MNYEQHSSAIQAVIADYFRGIHEGDIETLHFIKTDTMSQMRD